MQHRIRRQIIELELPREAGAIALQQRASLVFQEQVLPRLDTLFSAIAPPDRYICIEHLMIDLGKVDETDWEKSFIETCVAQIAQQVESAAFTVDEQTKPTAKNIDASERTIAIVHYFLETGILPWYAKGIEINHLGVTLLTLLDQHAGAVQRLLGPLLRSRPAAVQRLVWQFPADIGMKIIEASAGLVQGWLTAFINLHTVTTINALPEEQIVRLYTALLKIAPGTWQQVLPTKNLTQQMPINQLIDDVFGNKRTKTKDVNLLNNTAKKNSAEDHLTISKDIATDTFSVPFDDPKPQKQPATIKKDTITNKPAAITDRTAEPRPGTTIRPDAEQGLSVDNVGLVLTAVYLSAFLGGLGRIKNNRFENKTDQYRAIHILYYVATGLENPEEPVLLFPKILCGMDLEEPVPLSIVLTETEKEEANNLLQAVIDNWGILKNTSIHALRDAFLQRPGQIIWKTTQNAWLLQVERKAQDILIERLPWTISVIKLPWMDQMIIVEW